MSISAVRMRMMENWNLALFVDILMVTLSKMVQVGKVRDSGMWVHMRKGTLSMPL